MAMPGRKYQQGTSSYRYSINGQEKESELNENITTAEYWEYDSRIGRRWNYDPRPNPSFSPYSAFNCNPIYNTDPLGDTSIIFGNDGKEIDRNTKQKGMNFYMVDKDKYTALKDKNADAYINDYGGFEKNMVSEFSAAKQKVSISAEETGTAYNTGTVYTYKGKDYAIQRTMPTTGKVTFTIPFDNGRMANLSFDIDMGGGGAGLTPNGKYVSNGFKKGWEGNFNHKGEGAYTAKDGFGFKLPCCQ